jgi:hypothetical protein
MWDFFLGDFFLGDFFPEDFFPGDFFLYVLFVESVGKIWDLS